MPDFLNYKDNPSMLFIIMLLVRYLLS